MSYVNLNPALLCLLLPTVHPMLRVTHQYCPFHFTSLIYSWFLLLSEVLSVFQRDYGTSAKSTEMKA